MRMSWEDFERVTLAEFLAAYEGYAHAIERDDRTRMEVARWSALVDLAHNPWIKVDTADIGSLLPLPWHNTPAEKPKQLTEVEWEQRRHAALEMVDKYVKSGKHTH